MTLHRYGAKVFFVLYIVVVCTTAAVFFTIWGRYASAATFWISLASILIAETALWKYVDHLVRNLERAKRMVPGYAALGTVIAAYFVLTVIYSLFAGWSEFALRVFLLLQSLTLAAAVILCGLIMVFIQAAMKQELDIEPQVAGFLEMERCLKQLQSNVAKINVPGKDRLETAVAELIEKVRFSDPIAPAAIAIQDQILLDEAKILNDEVASILTLSNAENQALSLETVAIRIDRLQQKLVERNAQVLAMKS